MTVYVFSALLNNISSSNFARAHYVQHVHLHASARAYAQVPEFKSSCVLDMLEEVRSLNHIETAQILVRLFLGRGKIEYFMDYLIERDIENCRKYSWHTVLAHMCRP